MHLHPTVSFLVGVILDLLQLKCNGNGNQGRGVSSDDSSTSPFNTHPVIILLGVLWLLLYSWVALAAYTTTVTSFSSPTFDSPSNRAVAASDLPAATAFPSSSSPAPASTSAKIAVAETPSSSASAAASCSSSPVPASSSNALSSSVKMAVAETPLSSAYTAASCSSSPGQVTSSNPSLSAPGGAAVVIMIPTSSPTVAVSATSSSWISIILGKINNPASKLIAKIKCRPEQLMLMFASMAICSFGCLLFPTSVQYRFLYTSYALIIGFNAVFLCRLPRQGDISPV